MGCFAVRRLAWGLVVGLAAFGMFAGSSLAASGPAGTDGALDGVPRIHSSAEPANGRQVLDLEPVWRAGSEDDDIFFGLIVDIVEDEDGALYALDSQFSVVQAFSPDGHHLATLSRQGEGPGESQNPCDLIYLPDRTLGIVQSLPGKIIKVGVDGTPKGTFRSTGTSGGPIIAFVEAQFQGDNLVVAGVQITTDMAAQRQVKRSFLASYDDEGERYTYTADETVVDFNDIVVTERGEKFVYNRWCLDPTGRVAVAGAWDEYEVRVYGADGALERVISRKYVPLPKSDREKKMLEEALAATRRQQPVAFRYDAEPNTASIREMHYADNGELWVLPSRGVVDQPDGIMATYDVFDIAGRFDRQVSVCCSGDGEDDLLMFAHNGSVVLVKGFLAGALSAQHLSTSENAEPMQIVYCRAKMRG